MPGHIDAQGSYARAAALLLPALLPDLTDPVAGSRLGVEVAGATTCAYPAALNATSDRPAVDFATQASVVAMGLRQVRVWSWCSRCLLLQ